MSKLYYTAPSQEVFDEMKEKCIELWQEKDNAGGYVDEKVARIKEIGNVSDNFMTLAAMFDSENMKLLAEKLSEKTRQEAKIRMIDGGNPDYLIPF